MHTMGLCPLEIRSIIERAFLPLACTCEQGLDESFSVRIEDPHAGKLYVVATDIPIARMASSRAISDLIAELRGQLAAPVRSMGRLPDAAHAAFHRLA